MIAGFLRRWRHRINFLKRETAYQGRGLGSMLAALAFASAGGGPILVLVAAPAQARSLSRLAPLVCRERCEVRAIVDLTMLEANLADIRAHPRRVLLAGELYARFHARLAADFLAGRLAVA